MAYGKFTPNAGAWKKEVPCDICKTTMNVETDLKGPTSIAEARAKLNHEYDLYICPNRKKIWHKHLTVLTIRYKREASSYLRNILRVEIERVLHTQQLPPFISEKDVENFLSEENLMDLLD